MNHTRYGTDGKIYQPVNDLPHMGMILSLINM